MALTRLAEEYWTERRWPWIRPRSSISANEAPPLRPARNRLASLTRWCQGNGCAFPTCFAAAASEAAGATASAHAATQTRRSLIGRILAPPEAPSLSDVEVVAAAVWIDVAVSAGSDPGELAAERHRAAVRHVANRG